MSYYQSLGLKQEPFSASPDPVFLYKSSVHKKALQRLEIAVRLKRGLSLVLGNVGTGKTTLARSLISGFSDEDDFDFRIILDPHYSTREGFIAALHRIFNIQNAGGSNTSYIEDWLFRKYIEDNKTVVLVIDEGQKITPDNLEVLRVLLNYETNAHKLIQIIILAQMELLPVIQNAENLIDRISFKYILKPLNIEETKGMIKYRLRQAGYPEGKSLFTLSALKTLYKYTRGYPRKITRICHHALEALIMYQRPIVDTWLIEQIVQEDRILNREVALDVVD